MVESEFVFHYVRKELEQARRQAENYLCGLDQADEMRIDNDYSSTIQFEKMLFTAAFAALVFNNPESRYERLRTVL